MNNKQTKNSKNSKNKLSASNRFRKIKKTDKACGLHCIKVNNLSVKMASQTILEDINIHIHCGKMTAVIGQNGAGKSTFVKALIGEIPHEGTVEFTDKRTNSKMNMDIGYVPQYINVIKNTPVSVYDLFESTISKYPVFLPKRKKDYQYIKDQLEIFMAQDLIDKSLCDLSGGELQRVMLSLAITPVPNLLLLDEPVSGMDDNGTRLFYENINYLKNNYDLAVILVSHDLEYVAKYADNVILLNKGVLKTGAPKEVFSSKEFKEVFGHISFEEVR